MKQYNFYRSPFSFLGVIWLLCLSFAPHSAHADNDTLSLQQLLQQVQQGQGIDRKTQRQRIQQFTQQKQHQQQLLTAIKQEKQSLEANSSQLEKMFADNQTTIDQLETQLDERLGNMKELFGVLQQVSTESQSQFNHSLTQLQFAERNRFLADFSAKMGKTTQLPKMEDIERLWFELLREATESGKVVTFPGEKVRRDGKLVTADITRIGLFNLVSDGNYLQYIPETGRAAELLRQPNQSYLNSVQQLSSVADNKQGQLIAIDPTRGQLLGMLIQLPDWRERLQQGGYIGWAILAVGLVALLITVERYIALSFVSQRVQRQIKHQEPSDNNPLGRLLKTHTTYRDQDLETLELKLGEQLLQELPKLNQRLLIIKVITVIAPLMGLLGTVTGMIFTFQSITLFGTGDPKLMAGGISQALITTVLGLAVAIPGLLMHTLVSSKAKNVSQILEEQAAGMIAERALSAA